ncbi:hypothetical protein [Bradyrhizobium sp. CCBAU 51765]|uniref:hypothetical protein n=1 Tax=Bradyrhizobium sp. CCBAU 51765 TaxID=1325102 RepID=UPI001887B63F|nr:hypothetical protein [Bradyrhizobium sp. CCBAU 51765]
MPQAPDMPRTLNPTRVIARFAVRLVLLMGFAAFGSVGFGRSLAVLLWMSIVLCALASLVRREPLFGAALNHWDEAVAFGALFALVHVVIDPA